MTEEDFNPFTLDGKRIVITGASSGIGQQCAISCSRMNARVVLIGRNADRLAETLGRMKGEGHISVSLDLTDYDGIPAIVKSIVDSVGKIDGLIHCAGISTTLPLNLVTNEKLVEFMSTNVLSAINLSRELFKRKYSNDGGSIIFMASVMGVVGERGKMLYGLTKGALISGARSLACELSKRNIRVNCISPGAIQTPINEKLPHMADPELRAQLEDKHLLGLGKTTDIANGCIYLLSDAARWITGQNLIIDGGYTAQ